jgi:maltose O-acetyltransferase
MYTTRIREAIKKLAVRIFRRVSQWEKQKRKLEMTEQWVLPSTVDMHETVDLCGNVKIGEYSYANEGTRIASGENSSVEIGKFCEIGRYVHIVSYTHDMVQPTNTETEPHLVKEGNIHIGDYVWIGDKVLVREGISIGNHAIIGANSVVVKDVNDHEVVGGVPASHIKYNKVRKA